MVATGHLVFVEQLADRLTLELTQSHEQEQDVEEAQCDEDRDDRKMRRLQHQRGAQSFTGINQWIHKHSPLQNMEVTERTPRIVGAAEEDHRSEDHAEHEADMLLVH